MARFHLEWSPDGYSIGYDSLAGPAGNVFFDYETLGGNCGVLVVFEVEFEVADGHSKEELYRAFHATIISKKNVRAGIVMMSDGFNPRAKAHPETIRDFCETMGWMQGHVVKNPNSRNHVSVWEHVVK